LIIKPKYQASDLLLASGFLISSIVGYNSSGDAAHTVTPLLFAIGYGLCLPLNRIFKGVYQGIEAGVKILFPRSKGY
jgi:hypothetical protein